MRRDAQDTEPNMTYPELSVYPENLTASWIPVRIKYSRKESKHNLNTASVHDPINNVILTMCFKNIFWNSFKE